MSEGLRKPIRTVRFHYIKSSTFHTIHCDGGVGSINPTGDFHLALYSERFPIPTQTEHEVTDLGPGREIAERRVIRDGVVRELQADIVFDYRAARTLRDWLDKNLRVWERMMERGEE